MKCKLLGKGVIRILLMQVSVWVLLRYFILLLSFEQVGRFVKYTGASYSKNTPHLGRLWLFYVDFVLSTPTAQPAPQAFVFEQDLIF